MLHDPARHEALQGGPWNAARARSALDAIVRDTRAATRPAGDWLPHPDDLAPRDNPEQDSATLYFGSTGVVWALRHLAALGAGPPPEGLDADGLCARNRAWLRADGLEAPGSYLMGELPIALMAWEDDAGPERAGRMAALIDGNVDHPARELMWGAPGSLLAASFLHQRSGDAQWAERFRRIAARLGEQLHGYEEYGCACWSQELYGRHSSYLDAVHGFVATAQALIRGRHLLDAADWAAWHERIVTTVSRTATWDGPLVNWRAELIEPRDRPTKWLMQYCHGAPGFVVCLADLPGTALDPLLLAAGEAVWAAGPLRKGANLCHGTAGNGYSFLKLFRRSGDERWLDRARAFAMHAIMQAEDGLRRHGRRRHSLWTGDPGLAIYLWNCLQGSADFPTVDLFFAPRATPPT